MRVVELCHSEHCPVVKIGDEHVESGERDNVCVLTKSDWGTLKGKTLNKEIETELIRQLTDLNPGFTEFVLTRFLLSYPWSEFIQSQFPGPQSVVERG